MSERPPLPVSRGLRLALLVAVGLAQLAVPLGMIAGHERILEEGAVWRFRTAPVDPADAFRGRYLALGFAEREAPLAEGVSVRPGNRVAVPLAEGEEGFAELGTVRREPPEEGDWLRLRVLSVHRDEEGRTRARVLLPFDRLYLEESVAPRAEEAYRQLTRGEEGAEAWTVVRVLDGRAALEDVVVGGRSIRELVEEGGGS